MSSPGAGAALPIGASAGMDRARDRAFRAGLYIVFTVSGAAGLFYEMVWSRYLAIFLGHSAYAQTLVIAIFLGGMALGALWMGSRSARLRDPLVGYAAVELVVGAIGLFFHEIYLAVTGFAHGALFPELAGGPLLTVAKWGIAAALILPQSVLLGATFPFMTAGILRRFRDRPGGTLALAYFANSLGAAAGVLIAGFYLVSLAGLPGTVLAAAILNLAAALAVVLLAHARPVPGAARGEPTLARSPGAQGEEASADDTLTDSPAGPPTEAPPERSLARLLLAISFGTAVASFAYEIGWLRMLALVLGSATHSFELMLSAFILGLALGSLAVRRRADRWRDPLRALGIVQWAMGLSALATLALYGSSFEWMAGLLGTFDRTDAGYIGFTLARYAICLAIMLPASFCAGMTLPLITRTLLVRGMGEEAIGKVYGVNTLGSIVGVAAAGLVLLPWLGLKGLIVAGAGLDMALGVAVLWFGMRVRPGSVTGAGARRLAYGAAAATAIAVGAGLLSRGFDRGLLVSGVYRHGNLPTAESAQVRFYADGRTATVGVKARSDGHLGISTNGKADASLSARWFEACPDSSEPEAVAGPGGATGAPARGAALEPLGGDESTQLLLPTVTLAHAPDARTAAVIGQGSGMSSHFLLASPALEEVVTIEIEPQMVRGSREFYPANRRVFDDPRSRIVIEDARTYFASSGRRFDYIFSEPSNPWVSGVASLFTTEFYAHVKRHLTDDGIFGQWIHLYEIDDGLVLSVLAALHQNFGDYRLFMTSSHDMLVVATPAPRLPEPDWSVFDLPALRADLCHAPPLGPAVLDATRLTGRRALAPVLDAWDQPNSEFYPVVDLLAERTRYLQTAAAGFVGLSLQPFDIAAALGGDRSGRPVVGRPGLNLPRVGLAARAAAVRAAGAGREPVAANGAAAVAAAEVNAPDDRIRRALYRRQRWETMLADDRAPAGWDAWLQEFARVRADATVGTAGDPPVAFYAPIPAFLRRHEAPDRVGTIVSFHRALDAWAFAEAAALADEIAAAELYETGAISADALLEGGVVAKLRIGDPAGARRLYETLGPHRRRHPGDLRARIIDAYIEKFAPGRAPPQVSGGAR